MKTTRLLLILSALAAFTPSALAFNVSDFEAKTGTARDFRAGLLTEKIQDNYTDHMQVPHSVNLVGIEANTREIAKYSVCVFEPGNCRAKPTVRK